MNYKRNLLITLFFAFLAHQATIAKDIKTVEEMTESSNIFSDGDLKNLGKEMGYVEPLPVKRGRPRYPELQSKKSQAGIVDIALMVNTDGTVFEPIVIDSTHTGFESPALKAVKRYIYKPATLDGKPVKSATSIRVKFEMRNEADAAGKSFVKRYKRVNQMLTKDKTDKERIRKKLDSMADENNLSTYALAYLYSLESRYAMKYLGKKQQLDALEKLLLFESEVGEKAKFLTDDMIRSIRMNILQLLINTGRYGEARKSYYYLKKQLPEAAKPFKRVMKKIYEILKQGKPFSRSVSLTDRGYEFLYLTKQTITFEDIQGKIEELKFRCDRNFAVLKFQADNDYTVPESWGRCDLQIVGEPNTTAKLFQL